MDFEKHEDMLSTEQDKTRREFLIRLGATIPGVMFAQELFALTEARNDWGILLGTFNKEMTSSPVKTLQFLARLGYKNVEYPATWGLPVKELKLMIADSGLKSIGGGETISNIEARFSEMVVEYVELEKQYLMCYWPWHDDGTGKTVEDWKRNCDVFNKLGKRCKAEGLKLAYHNHAMEFFTIGGTTPYDILLQNTDPDLVTMEMDLWWIAKGGRDPMDFIDLYPGRFELCHIKTKEIFDKSLPVVDYKAIMHQCKKAGIKHVIIENEMDLSNPSEYAVKSAAYLKKII